MATELLRLDDIHVSYGGVKALSGLTLTVNESEIVALMGPNGAGKSTVLKAIFGIAPITRGAMHWRGKKILPVPHELVEAGIAFVPQGRRVFPTLTVEENLEIGGAIVPDKKERKRRIREALEIFPDLKMKLREKSGLLSGGQQQMVAVARGLMIRPQILLLDEPTLGLSPKLVKEMFAKIKEINERQKTAIVVVEHNIKSILGIATRAYILDKGRVAAEDSPQKLIEEGILEKVFLGGI